jgi:hypothetical protein
MPSEMASVRRGGPWAAVVTFGLATGAVAPSIAQEEEKAEVVALAYRASEGCPDEATFIAQVRARMARGRIAGAAEASQSFAVALEAGPPAYGSVTLNDDSGRQRTRRVQADTCADAASALSLVVALAIDPSAKSPSAPAPSPPAESATPPIAPPASSSGSWSYPSAPREPQEGAAPPSPLTKRTGARGAFFAGVDVSMDSGVSPRALFGPSPYLGWQAGGARALAPSFRLAFLRAATGPLGAPDGTAAFAWTVGRLDACPVALAGQALRATACARLEAGSLQVTGGAIADSLTRVRPWFAAGVLARAEWTFLAPLFLDANVGALVRATTDRFFFLPDTTVSRVPSLGASVGAGAGAHFL